VTGESQYLSFHGVGVHYRVVAPQDKPRQRVMLLSSPLISTFHWRKIVPELTQLGCMVVLIDMPGFGKSACGMNVPQDGAMRSNILWGVLDEIDRQTEQPDSLWHLVGHGSACAAVMDERKEPETASALENWYRQYEKLWLEVSQPNELWRIKDVVCWYADELR